MFTAEAFGARGTSRRGRLAAMGAVLVAGGLLAGGPATANDARTPPEIGQRLPTLEALVARCGSGSLAEREMAFLQLLDRSTPRDVPALVDALYEAPRTRSRTRVARVLGSLGVKAAEGPLMEIMLHDGSRHARGASTYALGELGSKRAIEPLITTLNSDPHHDIRKRAAVSLHAVGGADAREAIERAAGDSRQRWDVRRAAQWLVDHPHRRRSKIARAMPGQVTSGTYKSTDYLLYVPKSFQRKNVYDLLVVIHGTGGLPEGYMQMCIEDAERHDLVVLAPHFDWPTFPDFGRLNAFWGEVRADRRLLDMIDDDVGVRINLYDGLFLFGHSQGGAFVHRFAAVHPDRVERAAVSSANTFLVVDDDRAFPEGFSSNPMLPDLGDLSFAHYVTLPIMHVVGEREETRFIEPARRFVSLAREFAADGDLACRSAFQIVPGSEHSARNSYEVARDYLFVGLDSYDGP
jgi:pimeloyl-ACP methyl ester carboxylesterase